MSTPTTTPLLPRPRTLDGDLARLWRAPNWPGFVALAGPFDDGPTGPRRRAMVAAAAEFAGPLLRHRTTARGGSTERDVAQDAVVGDVDAVLLAVEVAAQTKAGRPVPPAVAATLAAVAGSEHRARAVPPPAFAPLTRWQRGVALGVLETLEGLAGMVLAPAGDVSPVGTFAAGFTRAVGMGGDDDEMRRVLAAVAAGMPPPDFERFEPLPTVDG